MSEKKRAVFPAAGARPSSPYSPAIVSGRQVYVSGQVGVDPATGELAGDNVAAQARQTFENISHVLAAAGCDLSDVVKSTAYLTRQEFFATFNDIYREYFGEPYPARTTVICDLAVPHLLIEVDVIAHRPAAD